MTSKQEQRDTVWSDYNHAVQCNQEAFERGDVKASSQYIYDNQAKDAAEITDAFYKNPQLRAVSIIKRTKVGMDGLMIELSKNMTTHQDDNFVLDYNNVYMITGMSNTAWETDLRHNAPMCFRKRILHHGKLKRIKDELPNIRDALIILDEIDCGNKEGQQLHEILRKSGIWSMEYLESHNIRFVFVSATMVREIRELIKWGDRHHIHYMTIPDTYISHHDFLQLGIIQEYYPIETTESAERWITEDVLTKYQTDYRVHIIRSNDRYKKHIMEAATRLGVKYQENNLKDRMSHKQMTDMFDNLDNHVILIIKGFYRRANLIPNAWKVKIGAVHERCVKKCNTSVQVQGLPGRMTGYWRDIVMGGHVTGPYRTSVNAMIQYENFYQTPTQKVKYKTASYRSIFQSFQ